MLEELSISYINLSLFRLYPRHFQLNLNRETIFVSLDFCLIRKLFRSLEMFYPLARIGDKNSGVYARISKRLRN